MEKFLLIRTERHTESVEYLAKTWIDPHKEKFVPAWTNLIRHFGHTVTSRGEGAHNVVKDSIASSMENLFGCCERNVQSIKSFQIELTTELAKQPMKIIPFAQPTLRSDIFQHINRKISYYALRKVFEPVSLYYYFLPTCFFQSLEFRNDSWKSSTSIGNQHEAMLFYFFYHLGDTLRVSVAADHRKREEA